MTAEPLVTVIMNCFNAERYLRDAIDSVYEQTYKNWEIVLWDNGSTDSTAQIAKSFDNRVRYFRADRTTPLGEARAKAVDQAKGDLIAFLDHDDIYLKNRLEDQVKEFWPSDAALSYSGFEEITPEGRSLRKVYPVANSGDAFSKLLNQFDITVATMMLKRDILQKYKFNFDPNVVASEEYNLLMRLAAREKVCAIHKCLAKWRIQANSLTNQAISRWADEREYTLQQIEKENPGIRDRYPEGFAEAYARAKYYRARYLVSQGKKPEAISNLQSIAHVDPKYRLLSWSLYLPTSVWNFLHKDTLKRKYLAMFLKPNGKDA